MLYDKVGINVKKIPNNINLEVMNMNKMNNTPQKNHLTPPPKRNHQQTLDNLARLLEQQKLKVVT